MQSSKVLFDEGLALHQQGDLDAAVSRYEAALQADPGNARALHMRGVVHLQRGEHEEAVSLIRRAIKADRSDAFAYGNLATALLALKRLDEAIEAGRQGVRVDAQAVAIWGNLATALTRAHRYPDAVEALECAIALDPDRPGFHSALGHCLGKLERYDEALESHGRALSLAPDAPQYRNNMAVTLRAMKLDAEAEEMLRSAIQGGLNDVELRGSLAQVLRRRGKFGEALETYRAARDEGLDHTSLDSEMMFFQNHHLDAPAGGLKSDAIDWARRFGAGITPFAMHANKRTLDRPLRIGLVSGDFRAHPVGRFLQAPLAQIDPNVVTLHAYSAMDNDDEINLSIRSVVPNWRSTRLVSDEDLALQIRRDQIDILVDLSGITALHRLRMFMYRPAPIAVTWLGYFATTGIEQIDYVLCNKWLIPEHEENQWVERPWRLPSAHWCYKAMTDAPEVVPSPALAAGHLTFGCYNNFDKLTSGTLAAWARILDALPDSRLLLRSGNKEAHVKQRIIDDFARYGYAPGDRLMVDATAMDYAKHMKSYGLLDVALDPFPYNGGTTTVEALYMGVPVLTLHGDRFVAHMAESNIRSAGLHDWVAKDVDDYVRRAANLTADVTKLAAMRANLRDQVLNSRLFDAKAFALDLQEAFKAMWAEWVRSQRA